MTTLLKCIFIIFFIHITNGVPPTWPPKIGIFNQTVDHFNFAPHNPQWFTQRYFYEDKFWDKKGPIFFYTGNEGELESFWNNTGFMFDIAPARKALIIFAEHRYYGNSLPFGPEKSFTQPYMQYLSVEQALADFAYLIDYLKVKFNASHSPIITFGGSYGGMLAGYMRIKYPNLVQGALAASAPIYWVAGLGNNHEFFEIITKDAYKVSPHCVEGVKKGYQQIISLANGGSKGLSDLSTLMRVCKPLNSTEDVDHLMKWIRNAWIMMAMMDYPYASEFMASLPANPIQVACQKILSSALPAAGLRDAAAVFYNMSVSTKCFDIFEGYVECSDITGCGVGPSSYPWDFQACTEMVLFDPSNNTQADMFPSLPLSGEDVAAYCLRRWGVTRASSQLRLLMWGGDMTPASNIIFSNGDVDPWHGGGVLKNVSSSVISLMVEGGAHHYDLRGTNPKDSASVIAIRKQEAAIIDQWIHEYHVTRSRSNRLDFN